MVSAPVSPVENCQGDTKSVFDTYFPLATSQPTDHTTQASDSIDGVAVNSSEVVEQDNNEIGFLDNNNNVTDNTEDGDISNIFGDSSNETTTTASKGVLSGDYNPFNTLLDDADTIVNNDNSDSDNSDQEEDESSDTEQTVVNSNDE